MYHQHFGLSRSPFNIEPDPDFLWLGETHQEGLSVLQYGISENKGFVLLTGEAGTGKTVLTKSLLAGLGTDVVVATIPDPGLALLEILNFLANELGMAATIDDKADFLIKFKQFVHRVYDSTKSLLIIIDEAQRLTGDLLDEIRVLTNIDFESRKLINIFFVGQIEFIRILEDPRNRALRQRITVSCHLAPLDRKDTDAYIRHRLKVAGSEKALFMPEAVDAITRLSDGIPRRINALCDRALVTAYSRDLNRVSAEMIGECARELDVTSIPGKAPDRTEAEQVENPPVIRDGPDQGEAFSQPAGVRRRWVAAALVGAAILLLAGVVFVGGPEKTPMPAPASAEKQVTESSPKVTVNPVDSSPAVSEEKTGLSEKRAPARMEPEERLFSIFFKPGSSELDQSSYEILGQVSDYLSAYPHSEVTLTTPTASDAPPQSSLKLRELRAAGIRSVLAAKPEFKGTLTVAAAEMPGDRNPTAEGFSKPRMEIRIKHQIMITEH